MGEFDFQSRANTVGTQINIVVIHKKAKTPETDFYRFPGIFAYKKPTRAFAWSSAAFSLWLLLAGFPAIVFTKDQIVEITLQ